MFRKLCVQHQDEHLYMHRFVVMLNRQNIYIDIYRYKNIKKKLYKTKAEINLMCVPCIILQYVNDIKLIDTQQAEGIHNYKNIKEKLYKYKAAIWYNKTCRQKNLTTKYRNIKINDNKTMLKRN
jgi:hypothetical protein